MVKLTSLGIGAGLVSALLFGVMTTGTVPGVILSYVAPLPILIVALGWHRLVGLLAAAIGALALTLVLRPSAGLAFAIAQALPAWWLACLALTGGVDTGSAQRNGAAPGEVGPAPTWWLPLGLYLLAIGLSGAFVALAVAIGLGRGDYATLQSTLRGVAEGILRLEANIGRRETLPRIAGVPGRSIVSALVALAPFVFAAVFTVALAVNVFIAAKVVAMSGRLPRPWPPIAEVRMPSYGLAALAAGILLALAPGYVGVAGWSLAGGVAMAFALQGLAFLHAITRGRPARGAILTLSYMLTVFFGATFLPLMALAGMIDSATPIRRRLSLGADGGPPTRPPTRQT